MKFRYLIYTLVCATLVSCKPELDEFETATGNADFSVYIALGNSLTAGYADGALYQSAQVNSYPNILAWQFQKAGGGAFIQPLMPGDDGVGITITPQEMALNTKLILGFRTDCLNNMTIAPVYIKETPGQTELFQQLIAPVPGPVNNFGIFGAKAAHLLAPGYGDPAGLTPPAITANPYYIRFASSTVSTVLGDAISLLPTFYTLWIGNNDVLGYAISGGVGDTITSQLWFGIFVKTIMETLNATGASGAVANIPSVTSIPFFTTVPYNALVLQDQAQVDALNEGYAGYNALMELNGLPYKINFSPGNNPMVIYDAGMPLPPEYAQYKFRQITNNELILLSIPQDSIKCAGWGSLVPVGDQYVLTESELEKVNNAIEGYNQTISTLAAQYGIVYVDVGYELSKLQDGVISGGLTLTSEYITGNVFSLDGIHLTPIGNAYIANVFIQSINAAFGSKLPIVNLTEFSSVILP
jgi:hypothetical protein